MWNSLSKVAKCKQWSILISIQNIYLITISVLTARLQVKQKLVQINGLLVHFRGNCSRLRKLLAHRVTASRHHLFVTNNPFKGYLLFILSQVIVHFGSHWPPYSDYYLAQNSYIWLLILSGFCMEVYYHHSMLQDYPLQGMTGDICGSVLNSISYFFILHGRMDPHYYRQCLSGWTNNLPTEQWRWLNSALIISMWLTVETRSENYQHHHHSCFIVDILVHISEWQ
jgi:hypothetical protein